MVTFARYLPRRGRGWEAWEDKDAVPPEGREGVNVVIMRQLEPFNYSGFDKLIPDTSSSQSSLLHYKYFLSLLGHLYAI